MDSDDPAFCRVPVTPEAAPRSVAGTLFMMLADGRRPAPGGWNRLSIKVDDLAAEIARLASAGVSFRSDVVHGISGDQMIADDPSGNPVELFQPLAWDAGAG